MTQSIVTENLKVGYDERIIIDDLDIEIPEGKITTIIGPNGCGKSTVLKAIGRIIKPENGTIYLNNEDIHTLSTGEIATKMAILPQSPQAPAGLTVEELVSYGRFPHQGRFGNIDKEDREIIDWAISVTGLTEQTYHEVDHLSGGQRQRVWIALALAQKTDLILLDEPTTYLDLAYQLEILELLETLNKEQGCTIAMVLHDLNLAARFADYMIAIRDGEIVGAGLPEEIMTTTILEKTFNIDATIAKDPVTEKPSCITYNLA